MYIWTRVRESQKYTVGFISGLFTSTQWRMRFNMDNAYVGTHNFKNIKIPGNVQIPEKICFKLVINVSYVETNTDVTYRNLWREK